MPRRKEGLVDRTLAGLLWSLMSAGGQTLSNAVVVVVLARLLTPSEFGVVGAAIVIVNFGQIFTHLGVGPALVHLPRITRDHTRVGFGISLILGLLFAVTLFLSSTAIGRFFQMPDLVDVVRALALIFPISGATSVGFALLQRDLRFRALATVELISFALGYGLVAIVLAALGFGVWALVAGHLGQALLKAVLILSMRGDHLGIKWSITEARELVSYGTGFSLAQIANYLATQGDNLVVGRFLGASSLGLYTRAYQFMMLPTNLVGTVLNRVMFPALAAVQESPQRLGRAYYSALGGVTMVTMPMAAVLLVAAPELVLVVLGPTWVGVTAPFQMLIVVLTLRTAYKISDSLAKATGAVYRRAWRQTVYAVAVLVGAFIGQALGGLEGVAMGVAAAVALNYGLMLHLATQLTEVTFGRVLRMNARHVLIAALVGGVAVAVRAATVQQEWAAVFTLSATVLVPAAVWLVLWLTLPATFGPEGRLARTYAQRIFGLVGKRLRA